MHIPIDYGNDCVVNTVKTFTSLEFGTRGQDNKEWPWTFVFEFLHHE